MTSVPLRRRRIGRAIAIAVIVVAGVITTLTLRASRTASFDQTSSYRATSPGDLLTQVSLGPGTQLRAVDMLTATFGYGVATTNDVAQNRSYLVVTRDAARH